MTSPIVSVVLCTHNGERYLEEQLDSIAAQTVPIGELIVGDDDSTDTTLDIVERFRERVTFPVRVLRHSPALGVANNFASAVAEARGEVIALSDQDDRWHADKLERMLPLLANAELGHSDARLIDGDGDDLGATLTEWLELSEWERERLHSGSFTALLRRNLVTGATVIARSEALRRALPIPEGWIHDEWFAVIASLHGGTAYLDEATIDYRQHGDNEIGVRKLGVLGKARRLLRDGGPDQRRKAVRAMALARAAAARGFGSASQRASLVTKARHERVRAALPASRIRRIPMILRGIVRGNYANYSRWEIDVPRDLLERREEPPHAPLR